MLRRAVAAGAAAAGRLGVPGERCVAQRGSSFSLRCLGSGTSQLAREATQDAGMSGKAPPAASAGAAAAAFRPATAGPEWLGGDKQVTGADACWQHSAMEIVQGSQQRAGACRSQ